MRTRINGRQQQNKQCMRARINGKQQQKKLCMITRINENLEKYVWENMYENSQKQ